MFIKVPRWTVVALVAALLTACTSEAAPDATPPSASVSDPHGPAVFSGEANVHAFVDTTGATPDPKIDQALASIEAAHQVTHVHPTYVECDTDGRWQETIVPRVDAAARSRGLQVAPRVGCQDQEALGRILLDETTRAEWVEQTIALADRYDGVAIDMEILRAFTDTQEAEEYRQGLLTFVRLVADGLPEGKELMTVVVPRIAGDAPTARSAFYDLERLPGLQFAMAWRKRAAGESVEGALNPLGYVQDVIDGIEQYGRPADTVLGMPLYAVMWHGTESSDHTLAEIAELQRAHGEIEEVTSDGEVKGFVYEADGGRYVVWYCDGRAARERAELAAGGGLSGIGFWRLGQEDVSAFWPELGRMSP